MAEEHRIILNGQVYDLIITLKNPDKELILPMNVFEKLYIEENLLEWPTKGYLEYKNDHEQIERYRESTSFKGSEVFYYRMDGTDEVEISLTPVKAQRSLASKTDVDLVHILEKMVLKIKCSIYDTEDLKAGTIDSKRKRIYFWDSNYNKAIESMPAFSTGEYLKLMGGEPRDMPDEERTVEVGELLLYLIEEKLHAEPLLDFWSFGENKIIWTSPASATLFDTLTSLVSKFVNADGFPAFFQWDRFENGFKLIAYDELFKAYADMDKEILDFPDNMDVGQGIGPGRANQAKTYSMKEFSVINAYKHTKMSGLDSMKAINGRVVDWYEPLKKEFKTAMEKQSVDMAKENFTMLAEELNVSRSTPMFALNAAKKENMTIEHKYLSCACETKREEVVGLCDILRAGIFLNDCLQYTVLGAPIRSPGQFVEVRDEKDTEGVWEDRFLGAWFVVGVVHAIDNSTYSNHVTAVKVNATENFEVPDDV